MILTLRSQHWCVSSSSVASSLTRKRTTTRFTTGQRTQDCCPGGFRKFGPPANFSLRVQGRNDHGDVCNVFERQFCGCQGTKKNIYTLCSTRFGLGFGLASQNNIIVRLCSLAQGSVGWGLQGCRLFFQMRQATDGNLPAHLGKHLKQVGNGTPIHQPHVWPRCWI